MRHLVQLLLPLYDNAGQRLSREHFATVRNELVERFGGLTAYARSPASGVWQQAGGDTVHDDIVVYEVMTETLDEAWWRAYRDTLEARFGQQSLIVRATPMVLL